MRTAFRRRGRSTTRRWRRTTSAPSRCTTCAGRTASTRPSRRAGRTPIAPVPHAAGDGGDCREAARPRAFTRRRCRSGCCGPAKRTAAFCATPATRSRASCTRRARPTSAACARRCQRPNVDAVDERAARERLFTDPSRPTRRRRRGRARRRDGSRRRAPLVIVSCGAVNSAALLLRSTDGPASATDSRTRPAWSAGATWRTLRR